MDTSIARLKEDRFDFVHESQKVFRTLMMATAFPGEIRRIEPVPLRLSRESHGPIAQAMLTLLDLETSFSVHSHNPDARFEVEKYLSINTNAAPVGYESADFVLCLSGSLDGRFACLKRGSLSEPHRSATVFYLVDRISPSPESGLRGLTMSGPGVKGLRTVYVAGLEEGEIASWQECRSRFPVGIDIYLVGSGGEVAGIPRSTAVAA